MSAIPFSSPAVEKAQSALAVASASPSASIVNLAVSQEATVNEPPADTHVTQQQGMDDVPPVPLDASSGDMAAPTAAAAKVSSATASLGGGCDGMSVDNSPPKESHRAEEGAMLKEQGARESAVMATATAATDDASHTAPTQADSDKTADIEMETGDLPVCGLTESQPEFPCSRGSR